MWKIIWNKEIYRKRGIIIQNSGIKGCYYYIPKGKIIKLMILPSILGGV